MPTLMIILFQITDQVFNFPVGSDVIASCVEDWWHAYKAIQGMKIV